TRLFSSSAGRTLRMEVEMKRRATLVGGMTVLLAGLAAAQDPEETRIPFQKMVTFNIAYGNSATAFVPAGQRLVITTVSAACLSESSAQLVSSFRVQAMAK